MLFKPNTCHNKSHFNPNICAIPPSQVPTQCPFSLNATLLLCRSTAPFPLQGASLIRPVCTKAELSTGQPPAYNNNNSRNNNKKQQQQLMQQNTKRIAKWRKAKWSKAQSKQGKTKQTQQPQSCHLPILNSTYPTSHLPFPCTLAQTHTLFLSSSSHFPHIPRWAENKIEKKKQNTFKQNQIHKQHQHQHESHFERIWRRSYKYS